jgi:PAS domain S-box-containing protein
MAYTLQDLIDIDHFQALQDRLSKIYSFPSSIIDNDGNILTATAWQEICTRFHRKNKDAERRCIQSDQYIKDHIHEASPGLTYQCPHGLVDNATPIVIDGVHYGSFFTGQFFFEKPDLAFFRSQAAKYGFDEAPYLNAVKKVPVWSREQLESYQFFIKGLIEVIAESGIKKLKEIENRKQIQKNEQRNRIILKTAMDGFWVTDTNGRLLEVNDAYCSMSGYTEQELLTFHISDLDVFESPEKVSEHIQNVITNGSDRFQSRHRRKDGTLFDVEVSVQFHPELNGLGICFLRDITDQKRTEFEQESSIQMLEILNAQTDLRELMRALLKFMQKICGCDAVGIRLRKGNDFPYYEVSGFSEAFVAAETFLCVKDLNQKVICDDIGNPVLECMCGNILCGRFDPSKPFFTDFGSFVTDSTTRLLADTSDQDRQARTRNRCHGEGYESVLLIPLRTGGKTFGLLQFNDRKQGCFPSQLVAHLEKIAGNVALSLAHRDAEAALARRELTLNKIFDVLPIGLWVADKNGKLLRGNPAGLKIWGAELSVPIEAYGIFKARRLPSKEVIAPDDWALIHTVQKGMTITDELLEIDAFDGQKRIILNYTAPVINDNGEMLGAIIVNNDITPLKQAQAERENLLNQLSQKEKMESIGRLAGGVAHDFNNMLGVILGYTELALLQTDETNDLYPDLKEIQKAAMRSADLTKQLLTFARKDIISPRHLDLNDTVESMLNVLRRLIGEKINLVWKPGASLWPVKMDPAQIHKILANLCTNARDAIAGGGNITIITGKNTFDEEFCRRHPYVSPGDYVMLRVSDNGCGMDRDTLANLFEPFFTTKGVGKGTGLGLATVYGIVKQNNACMDVCSDPGQGTTFKIYLPRLVCDKDVPRQPAGPAHAGVNLGFPEIGKNPCPCPNIGAPKRFDKNPGLY